MNVQCPSCRTRYEIDDRKLSQEKFQVECPFCSTLFKGVRERSKSEKITAPQPVPSTSTSPSPSPSPSPPSPKPVYSAPTPVKKILLVDDSRFFREMILDILKPLHANFLMATDGVEALKVIEKENPDLVLLDLNLPKKNGYEVIREVRSNPSLKDICLLAMSGVYYKEVDAKEAKKVGANDFIKKSFTPEELQRFVKMWLIW